MTCPAHLRRLAVATLLCLTIVTPGRSEDGESDFAALTAFESRVRPVLTKLCVRCHGPTTQQADLRLDRLDPDLVGGEDGEHWDEVWNQLNSGSMPPEDETQPTAGERAAVTEWLAAELARATAVRRSTGGRNLLRRMTRYEYGNTLRDLLGVDLPFEADLPPEGTAEQGFTNDGQVLVTSSLHLEYYQRIARSGLEKALAFGERPEPFRHEAEPQLADLRGPKGFGKKKRDEGSIGTDASIEIKFQHMPSTGPLRLRIRAGGIPNSRGDWPRMHVEFGYIGGSRARPSRPLTALDVDAPADEPGVYEFHARAERFPLLPHGGKPQFVWIGNRWESGTVELDPEDVPRLVVESVEIVAPYHPAWPPETRTRILGGDLPEDEEGRDARVGSILERFLRRAYRRPPRAEEVDRMQRLYEVLRSRGESFESAIVDTLSAVLCSPSFLMLVEPNPVDGRPDSARRLTDHELAARLSYFLWSTMPDAELSALADEGRLGEPETLRGQVTRMLGDERARRFAEHFTSQWLDLDAVYRVAVNPEFFPGFRDEMKDLMREETIRFLETLLAQDESALALIDSDFAVLNGPLAEFYGIPGVSGSEFQRVPLRPEDRRGGVLAQASILLGNSTGDDTHPVERGVWVLERLLGDPPPPPPPNVPTLAAEEPGEGERLSLRERLAAHRDQSACANCHRRIDPFGVAFENYDGIGHWRPSTFEGAEDGSRRKGDRGKRRRRGKAPEVEVDPRTVLPDGTPIADLRALQRHLLEVRRRDVAETIVRRLLSYALGRRLEFTDTETVRVLTDDFERDDHRLRGLIERIVLSESFRTK